MSYRDTQLHCSECGRDFIWTVEEQREAAEAGWAVAAPAQCREHRTAARNVPSDAVPEASSASPAPFGRVKWFSADKGYGFLIEPNGDELFFHVSSLAPGVAPRFDDGDPVTYDVQYGVKGPEAVNVAPYRAP